MSKSERQKGHRYERELTERLRELGLDAKHVPASGAGRDFKGDVLIEGVGVGEAKYRRDGFRRLHRWLKKADFLALRAPQEKPGEKAPGWLVVMPLEAWSELVKAMLDAQEDAAFRAVDLGPPVSDIAHRMLRDG